MSEPKDELLDHAYDGIREYDNPLPKWWLGIFYISIIFALIYIPYYLFLGGPSQEDEYAAEMAAAAASAPKVDAAGEDALEKIAADAGRVGEGKALFAVNCMPCHAADAGGLVGPNLTDDHWIHGGRLTDIARVISEGVPEKGMIAWKKQLSPAQIQSLTAFVRSLRGTKPAAPKPPEGEPFGG